MWPVANTEMARAWNGDEGDSWTEYSVQYESATRRHWGRFLEGGFVAPNDRVLDVGCGTGKSTRDLARLAHLGVALGVDLSAQMLARARLRSDAEGLTNVSFVQADAQVHPFDQESFDLAVSSFGVMFFNDPVAAFTNIGRSLRPGGRLAMLTWRELASNEWVVAFRTALAAGRELPEPPPGSRGPFALADPARIQAVLAAAGFEDVELAEIEEKFQFGSDAQDAFGFVRTLGPVRALVKELDEVTRERVLEELYEVLVAHESDEGVLFDTSAWLTIAHRP